MVFSTNPGGCDCCVAGCEISRPSHPCWDRPLSTVVLVSSGEAFGPCANAELNQWRMMFRDPSLDIGGEIAYSRPALGDGITGFCRYSTSSPHGMTYVELRFGSQVIAYRSISASQLGSTSEHNCSCDTSIGTANYTRLFRASEINLSVGTPTASFSVAGISNGTVRTCCAGLNTTYVIPLVLAVSTYDGWFVGRQWFSSGSLSCVPWSVDITTANSSLTNPCPFVPDANLCRAYFAEGARSITRLFDADKDPRLPLDDLMFLPEDFAGFQTAANCQVPTSCTLTGISA